MANSVTKNRGFTELRSVFQNAPPRVRTIGRTWLKRFSQAERDVIAGEAPSKSGLFRSKIKPYARDMIAGIIFEDYPKLGQNLQKWIQSGTGIYGPRHTPIVPTHAKALRFSIGGRTLFRRSVRGMKPNPFVTRGVRKFNPKIRGYTKELAKLVADDLRAQIKRGR